MTAQPGVVARPDQVIAVIGAGQLGSSLVEGLVGSGIAPETIRVSTRSPEHAEALAARLHVVPMPAATAVHQAGIVVVAVRPAQVTEVLDGLRDDLTPGVVVVSLAGAPTSDVIAQHLPAGIPIARAMPNPAMAVGKAVIGFTPAKDCPKTAAGRARALLERVGTVIDLPEDRLGTIGTLAGHGQAVFYYVADALVQWAVMAGFAREQARSIVAATVVGAGATLTASDLPPSAHQNRLSTPGGTTVRATSELDVQGVRGAIIASMDGGRFA